jgi:hypothetical protein
MVRVRRIFYALLFVVIVVGLPLLKWMDVERRCSSHGSFESEKCEILERRNFLARWLVTSPQNVIAAMPKAVGAQFQGEWALYSCSMFAASLANISRLYPETKEDNIGYVEQLIDVVLSPELRYYDAAGELQRVSVSLGEEPITVDIFLK